MSKETREKYSTEGPKGWLAVKKARWDRVSTVDHDDNDDENDHDDAAVDDANVTGTTPKGPEDGWPS